MRQPIAVESYVPPFRRHESSAVMAVTLINPLNAQFGGWADGRQIVEGSWSATPASRKKDGRRNAESLCQFLNVFPGQVLFASQDI